MLKTWKLIIAVGVMGEEEDVERFAALWIADSERRAHRIVALEHIPVTILPLPDEPNESNGQ